MLAAIERAPLPRHEKFLCYLTMIPWGVVQARYMVKDLLVALHMALYSRKRRSGDARLYNWE